MDGIELLRRARPRFPSTIFVVVSGYPDDLVALYRTDAFPITVIPKPFRAEQVRRALALLRDAGDRRVAVSARRRGDRARRRPRGARPSRPSRSRRPRC